MDPGRGWCCPPPICTATLNVVVQNSCTTPYRNYKPHLSIRPENNQTSIEVFVRRVFCLGLQGFFLDLDCVRGRANMVRQPPTFSNSPQVLGYSRPSLGELPTQSSHLPTVCHRRGDNPFLSRHSPHIQILLPAHPPFIRIPRSGSPNLGQTDTDQPSDPPR